MIIGLDLSLTATGVAFLASDGTCTLTTLKSSPSEDDEYRLSTCKAAIMEVLVRTQPQLVVMEGLSFGSNDPSAQQRAWLHWAVRLNMWRRTMPFKVVAPTSLKKFTTGSGAAKKEQMMLEVFKRWGVDAGDNNQADAAALAFLGATYIGLRECDNQAQRDVIAKLKAGPVKKTKKRRTNA